MAKNKITDLKGSKSSMIPLHSKNEFVWSRESAMKAKKSNIEFDSVNAIKLKLKKFGSLTAKVVMPYLTLSAKTPYVHNKGYLNAVGCHSIYSNAPHISFFSYPNENQGPGKLEIWLTGLITHQKLTVEIRLSGYSNNPSAAYEVRSSVASGLYGYFPIQLNSKIDLYFPDVDDVSGQGLITIEPVDLTGSWTFYDVKVNVVE